MCGAASALQAPAVRASGPLEPTFPGKRSTPMRHRAIAPAFLFLLGVSAPGTDAQQPDTVVVELTGADGAAVGRAELVQTPGHGVLVHLRLEGLEPGVHALHIHETGRCEAPAFTSAGGHYAPRGRAHGVLDESGMHAGDLLNLHVPDDGRLEVEQRAADVTMREGAEGTLFDQDGSAVVLHAGADDYRSQPAGDAGERIACGVIRR